MLKLSKLVKFNYQDLRNILKTSLFKQSTGLGVLLILTSVVQAEVWECGDRYYSENPGAKKCKVLNAAATCGSGGNKYITRSQVGVIGSDEADDCGSMFDTNRSPFVDVEFVSTQKSKKTIEPQEKKLALPASSKMKGSPGNFQGGFTKQNLDNLPIPEIGKDIISQYMNIWGSYGKVLEE